MEGKMFLHEFKEQQETILQKITRMDEDLNWNISSNKHYQTKAIDVIDFCKLYDLNFNEGNVIKYVSRARRKGTHIQDLKKAIDYLNRELKHLENGIK